MAKMDKLKGSQFYIHVTFTMYGYDECSQIECALYHSTKPDNKIIFLKEPDENIPDAIAIENNAGTPLIIDLLVTEDNTNSLAEGKYMLEIKRTVDGLKSPVIKTPVEVFNLKASQTS